MTMRTGRTPIAHAIACMLRELLHGQASIQQLADAGQCAASTVRLWMHALHREGVVRICGYEKTTNGKLLVKLYELNPAGLPDARRPPKQDPKEVDRRYRAGRRALRINRALAGVKDD